MGLLSDGAQLIADSQAESDGEIVAYSRPAVFSPASITAVIGTPDVQIDGSTNLPARTESDRVDFLFRAVDMIAALGLTVVPQRGDRIDRTIGGKLQSYKVFADETNPAWEYGDPDKITVRVHARLAEVT